jgi:sugar O-acyltransferase (sialic acid O-acetyltransferase NeuD family)
MEFPNGKQRVFVVGAGGHGKVVIDALLSAGDCEIVGVIDDDEQKIGRQVLGIPVIGSCAQLVSLAAKYCIDGTALAIGDNYIREELFRRVKGARLAILGVIHPSACISRFAALGEGVVVLAGSVINPGSVVGDNVCVNTCASIDHDNHLEYSCHVFPNATLAGGVHVGECSYIGSGAVVIPNRRIGRFAYVGAGAVVIDDVPEGVKVAGVPAHVIGDQIEHPLQAQTGNDSAIQGAVLRKE